MTKFARIALAGAVIAAAIWLGLGVRRLDPEGEIGVVEGPLSGPAVTEGSWVLAPSGLRRLSVYPRGEVSLALPQAERARVPNDQGSPCGLRGRITLKAIPERWREIHGSAKGAGFARSLLAATREIGSICERAPRDGGLTPTLRAALEDLLSSELARRGLQITSFELDSVDFLMSGFGERVEGRRGRVLLVGLDGADWEIIDPLLEQGRMPNLQRLIETGVRADLLTISPMISPVVWTSIATGVEPTRHGILDFLVEGPDGTGRQPVTSAQRKSATVWEMLSRGGTTVGLVAWWASWPAEPLRGYVVSDRVAYQLFGFSADPTEQGGKTWPPGLFSEISGSVVEPNDISWDRVVGYLGSDGMAEEVSDRKRLDDFRTVLASGETYLDIALDLARRFEPSLEVVYFEGTDTVGHLFMPFRAPRMPDVELGRFRRFAPVIDRYYETIDGYLGRLLSGRGEEWTVIVASDHGFATDATRPRMTDSRIGHGPAADWHRRFGILVLSGAGIRQGAELTEANVYDIAPTLLALFGQPIPRSWPGRALAEALSPELLETHPVRYRLEDPIREPVGAQTVGDPTAADLMEKLMSLGYVSSGEAGSESLTARNNAGLSFLAQGRFEEAEQEFRAALTAAPRASMPMTNLALSLRLQGREDEATRLLRKGLDDPSTLRLAGNHLAQIELEAGRTDRAEEIVRQVLAVEPMASEVLNTLGLILEARGELIPAREEYARAAEADPRAALPRNNIGNLEQRRGNLDEAERWYLQAIQADPYFMGAYNNLALVHQKRGESDRAIDLYHRALGKAPEDPIVLSNLAGLYFHQGDRIRARRMWERSAKADPEFPSPLNNLAGVAIAEQRHDDARSLLDRALVLDPHYGDAKINSALLDRMTGDVDGARRNLRSATSDPRASYRAFVQLGMLELGGGDAEAAAKAFEGAVRAEPQGLDGLNGLGESYRRQGRVEEARRIWGKSLGLAPGQREIRRSLAALP